ncbi:MAG: FixH family protein [Hyphomonadaceae bacterium]|nr:FixH family protein [Hyphomonadaceae bacterium]
MNAAQKRPVELKGWHVLAAMLAFFGLVIAVNVVFAVFAINSFPGEDVRRSYLQGIQYNDTLAQRRAQAALGWRADVRFVEGSGGDAALEVALFDREGHPIDGVVLNGALQWPTDARRDQAIEFRHVGSGRYVAALPSLTEGRWRLRARAERGAEALDFEAELSWPSSR